MSWILQSDQLFELIRLFELPAVHLAARSSPTSYSCAMLANSVSRAERFSASSAWCRSRLCMLRLPGVICRSVGASRMPQTPRHAAAACPLQQFRPTSRTRRAPRRSLHDPLTDSSGANASETGSIGKCSDLQQDIVIRCCARFSTKELLDCMFDFDNHVVCVGR